MTREKDQNDNELLLLLREGDKDAFTAIYNRYYHFLYLIANKYLKNSFMAEDIVQSTFLKLWEMHRVVTIQISLKNFLYTILKHKVLNEIRNNNTAIEKNYELAKMLPESDDELLIQIENKEMLNLFYQTINQLSEQKKQVCLLKLRGNLSNQEIADLMHISVPTVKTHYAQAVKLLQARLSRM
jgi:RNA polymerase sigma-70 factor (ECF subfamily)